MKVFRSLDGNTGGGYVEFERNDKNIISVKQKQKHKTKY